MTGVAGWVKCTLHEVYQGTANIDSNRQTTTTPRRLTVMTLM
jgi:hypothetical protein